MPGNDERRPRRKGGESSNSGVLQGMTDRGQLGRWHAVATATEVLAGSGRSRFVLIWRCHCGARHVAHSRHLVPELRRTAGCGEKVILHVAVPGEVAA